MSKVGFGSSDHGGSFVDFEKGFPQRDGKDHRDRARRRLHQQADPRRYPSHHLGAIKRLVWLTPRRMASLGRSEMPRYAAFCSVVRQCATAKQLERAVSDIVAAYQ